MMTTLRMGTRASALARAQSGAFAEGLARETGIGVEVVIVRTEGDQLSSEGKAPPGGDHTGVFTRALDDALREGRVDFAVHSLKDLPTEPLTDLVLAAVPRRADARDALVVASRHAGSSSIGALPKGARVATGSPRRIAQLLSLRPDLDCVATAGNVDTRLRKLEERASDALILACAGLDRLGRAGAITARIPLEELLPAPGQGALAIVCRRDRPDVVQPLATLDDLDARDAVSAERSLLRELRGGCRAPIGAHAARVNGALRLVGRVLALDGSETLEAAESGADAEELGRRVAEMLAAKGAERLVQVSRQT